MLAYGAGHHARPAAIENSRGKFRCQRGGAPPGDGGKEPAPAGGPGMCYHEDAGGGLQQGANAVCRGMGKPRRGSQDRLKKEKRTMRRAGKGGVQESLHAFSSGASALHEHGVNEYRGSRWREGQ